MRSRPLKFTRAPLNFREYPPNRPPVGFNVRSFPLGGEVNATKGQLMLVHCAMVVTAAVALVSTMRTTRLELTVPP